MEIKNLNIEKTLFAIIRVEIICLIIFVFLSAYSLNMQRIGQEKLSETNQLRYRSYLLADQLRQSSDDLTRMVRTYVETEDSKFEDYFWDIIAIRDGIKPRPVNYERVYWDFMTVEQPSPPFEDGEHISLESLMKEAGFTENEFRLLGDAKKRSDKLVNLEAIAMHAMKGLFQDSEGEFTINGEFDREMARQIVFGEEYHEAKKSIMELINEFLKDIDQRTLEKVNKANAQVKFYQTALVSLFCILIINGLLLYLTIKRHHRLLIGKLKIAMDKQLEELSERRLAENEVKQQLLEKEIILKEVHHRIKNNFASLRNLLSLQSDSVTNSEAVSALQDAIGRVNSMQILYEKLLLTDDYKVTSIRKYLDNLMDEIIRLFLEKINITLEKHIDDFQLDPEHLIPVGIIVNELLTNIMKYAFRGRDSGLIEIKVTKNDGSVTLTIQDDGIGLPEGFDLEKQKGLGLVLIKMLTRQLNGSFTIDNHIGTRSIIKFQV